MTLATYTKQDIKYQEQRLVPCLKPLILIPNSLIFKSFTFHQNISYNIPRNICNFLSLHGDFAAALEPQCLFYIILCIIVLSIPKYCVYSAACSVTCSVHYSETLYILHYISCKLYIYGLELYRLISCYRENSRAQAVSTPPHNHAQPPHSYSYSGVSRPRPSVITARYFSVRASAGRGAMTNHNG